MGFYLHPARSALQCSPLNETGTKSGSVSYFEQGRDLLEQHVLSPVTAVVGKYVHPNHITAVRVPLTVAALAVDRVSHIGSTTTYAVATLLDWLDGAVARETDQQTREGAMLDPYVDKVTNALSLAYIVSQHSENIWLAIAATFSVGLNVLSQAQRGSLHKQTVDAIRAVLSPATCEPSGTSTDAAKISANVWGKIKQIIECTVITGMLAAGDTEQVQTASAVGLGVATALGAWGTVKRWVGGKKK